ncbi:hypothetical protein EJB05_29652, partial [Eragrostis curvula]
TSAALRRASKDGGVLAAIRAELAHELSSSGPSSTPSFPSQVTLRFLLPHQSVTPNPNPQSSARAHTSLPSHSQEAPDFATVSDAPQAQDVLLRRRTDSEEVLVSALLAPLQFLGNEPLRRAALMKVFVTKPGAKPVLHFDCRASLVEEDGGAADYVISNFRYHSAPGDAGKDKYEGPHFRELDPRLQVALQQYLVARGVNSNLASSILNHLLQKERAQYVNWLKTLEERFTKDS